MKTLKNSTTDPIADMLTRLRNALQIGATTVVLPESSAKNRILKVLKSEGLIVGYKAHKNPARLEVQLADDTHPPRLSHLRRLSKPGRRLYVAAGQIPTVRRGQGRVIVSTSQGVMTGHAARARRLGGELICELW